MTWNVEDDFVKKFSYNPDPRFHIATPIRSLVAYFNSSSNEAAKPLRVDENILDQPPVEYDNKTYLDRGKIQWSGHTRMPPSHQTSTR